MWCLGVQNCSVHVLNQTYISSSLLVWKTEPENGQPPFDYTGNGRVNENVKTGISVDTFLSMGCKLSEPKMT